MIILSFVLFKSASKKFFGIVFNIKSKSCFVGFLGFVVYRILLTVLFKVSIDGSFSILFFKEKN